MPTVAEALSQGPGSPLYDALTGGMDDLAQLRTVAFAIYQRVVLPLDGYVFWLRQSSFQAQGLLHWMTEREQSEDETATRISVVFTAKQEIQNLNQTDTQRMVVGEIEGRKYAFGRINWYFPQANIWHYSGEALHPAAATQLIDNARLLDPSKVIVSNSLPAWLALATYNPIWLQPANPGIVTYPSFLVPDNLEPPWAAVHHEPEGISALQALPSFGPTMTHYQLTAERVRVTLYGCNNNMASDFLDLVISYSRDTDIIGMMGAPTIRDGKRPWPEGMVLVQQKFIDFEVSYIQTRINDLARQLILDAQATVIPNPDP